jgi:hypothetical protein
MLFDNSQIRMSKIEYYLGARYPDEFKRKIKRMDKNKAINFNIQYYGNFQLLNENWFNHYSKNHDGLQIFIDYWRPFERKENKEFLANFYIYSEFIFLPFAKYTEGDRGHYLFFISEKNSQSKGEIFCIDIGIFDSEIVFIGNSMESIFGTNWELGETTNFLYPQAISQYIEKPHLLARKRVLANESIVVLLLESQNSNINISCEYYLKLSKIAINDEEYNYQDEITAKYILSWNNVLFEYSLTFELIEDFIDEIYFREDWFERYAMREITSHTRKIQMLQLTVDSLLILLEHLPEQHFNKYEVISFLDEVGIDSICFNGYTEFELIIL